MAMLDRREFIGASASLLAGAMTGRLGMANTPGKGRLNVLLITADDMNWNTPGCFGGKAPDITPNIDRLATEGVRFTNAHVTIAVCQPSRQVLMTGRFPHRFGATWFEPVADEVTILQEVLDEAGYINGCIGKAHHLQPEPKYRWSMSLHYGELKGGRDPEAYYRHCRDFFRMAEEADKPFFLMANSHDPHRPFHGSEDENTMPKGWRPYMKTPCRVYKPEEVEALGFLPDLPTIRMETAQYHSSVRRCDETVGEILRALHESGHDNDTLVMYLSDNGMAMPFAKCNCYLHSTKTPWIIRWPGHVEPGTVDDTHIISGIDFMPTILEATGCLQVEGMDGRSFLPLLNGGDQQGRDEVFTVFYKVFPVAGKREPEKVQYFPMRCLQNRRFGYIYNKWSDGRMRFSPIAVPRIMKAMAEAGKTDPDVKQRLEMFEHRVPEELYDFASDPHALSNLISDPGYRHELDRMRRSMLAWMEQKDDPLLPAFRQQIAD